VKRLHGALGVIASLLAAAAGAADVVSPRNASSPRASRANAFISAPDLAERIMRGDAALRVFDVRPAQAYAQFHIPTAARVDAADLASTPLRPETAVVLYGDDRHALADAVRAVGSRRGVEVRVLREGLPEWLARVHEPRLAVDPTPAERAEFERTAPMSRFFGGVPLAEVPRAELPTGYWTGAPRTDELLAAAALESVARIRRRGC
jgi:rhodanese-related sulfurtransferase